MKKSSCILPKDTLSYEFVVLFCFFKSKDCLRLIENYYKRSVLSRFMLVGTIATLGCLQWIAVDPYTYAVHFGQYSSAY